MPCIYSVAWQIDKKWNCKYIKGVFAFDHGPEWNGSIPSLGLVLVFTWIRDRNQLILPKRIYRQYAERTRSSKSEESRGTASREALSPPVAGRFSPSIRAAGRSSSSIRAAGRSSPPPVPPLLLSFLRAAGRKSPSPAPSSAPLLPPRCPLLLSVVSSSIGFRVADAWLAAVKTGAGIQRSAGSWRGGRRRPAWVPAAVLAFCNCSVYCLLEIDDKFCCLCVHVFFCLLQL